MKKNYRAVVIATIMELAMRTSGRVSVDGTNRGFGDVSKERGEKMALHLRDELAKRGHTNV